MPANKIAAKARPTVDQASTNAEQERPITEQTRPTAEPPRSGQTDQDATSEAPTTWQRFEVTLDKEGPLGLVLGHTSHGRTKCDEVKSGSLSEAAGIKVGDMFFSKGIPVTLSSMKCSTKDFVEMSKTRPFTFEVHRREDTNVTKQMPDNEIATKARPSVDLITDPAQPPQKQPHQTTSLSQIERAPTRKEVRERKKKRKQRKKLEQKDIITVDNWDNPSIQSSTILLHVLSCASILGGLGAVIVGFTYGYALTSFGFIADGIAQLKKSTDIQKEELKSTKNKKQQNATEMLSIAKVTPTATEQESKAKRRASRFSGFANQLGINEIIERNRISSNQDYSETWRKWHTLHIVLYQLCGLCFISGLTLATTAKGWVLLLCSAALASAVMECQEKEEDARNLLKRMVNEWLKDKESASKKYGPIHTWDVSEVKNFKHLFLGATSFNDDISGWNTGSATNMEG